MDEGVAVVAQEARPLTRPMPTPQEFYVLVPAYRPGEACQIWGPFRAGFRRGESPRKVAEWFAEARGGRVLGPFDPKKDPRRKRAMDETARTPNNAATIENMFRELERPKGMLERWELDFLHSIKDQFDRRGSLSEKQFTVLERIWTERVS